MESVCSICDRVIESNFELHMVVCQKNTFFCEKCKKRLPKSTFESHMTETHSPIKCVNCDQIFEICDFKLHQCSNPPVSCELCEGVFPSILFEDHYKLCSSRTELCSQCNKYILCKNYKNHISLNDCQINNELALSNSYNELESNESYEELGLRERYNELALNKVDDSSIYFKNNDAYDELKNNEKVVRFNENKKIFGNYFNEEFKDFEQIRNKDLEKMKKKPFESVKNDRNLISIFQTPGESSDNFTIPIKNRIFLSETEYNTRKFNK